MNWSPSPSPFSSAARIARSFQVRLVHSVHSTLAALAVAALAVVCPLTATPASAQTPLGTEFTYQGALELSGAPVTGTADFQFKLFGVLAGGTQIGSTQALNAVSVGDGVFVVSLDFGTNAFTGDKRWLEIAVRSPAGSGSFVTMTPRQPLAAAPYALKTRGVDGHSLDASDGTPTDALFVGPNGDVGIGTTSPATKLHIKGVQEGLRLDGTDPGNVSAAYISFRDVNGTETGWVGDGSTQNGHTYLASTTGDVVLYTGNEVFRAKPDGKIGMGTLTPIAGLHVHREPIPTGGTFALEGITHTYMSFYPDGVGAGRKAYLGFGNATSNDLFWHNEFAGGDINLITSGGGATRVNILEIAGADLAEKFPSSDNVEPGMVVAIDPRNPGQICLARGAYNSRVAGVVSGANDFSVGAVLGNLPGHEDAPPIALSGRVYVHCDASSGPIAPGDFLTTSDTPGHAMKAADSVRRQGAILGKAMTALESGRGMVLVLVSLQ